MKSYLKIKIKSLAAEAAIIRLEERRALRHAKHAQGRQGEEQRLADLFAEYGGLHRHRIEDVRWEARSACLAYAFLRGRRYGATEPAGSSKPSIARVAELVSKYGYVEKKAAADRLKEWIDGGPAVDEPRPSA